MRPSFATRSESTTKKKIMVLDKNPTFFLLILKMFRKKRSLLGVLSSSASAAVPGIISCPEGLTWTKEHLAEDNVTTKQSTNLCQRKHFLPWLPDFKVFEFTRGWMCLGHVETYFLHNCSKLFMWRFSFGQLQGWKLFLHLSNAVEALGAANNCTSFFKTSKW